MKIESENLLMDCAVARTYFQKAMGLMFKQKIEPLIFIFEKEKMHRFHTFFMLKTIDMIFLDSQGIVVDKRTARPFIPHITPKKPAKYVIELPAGYGTKIKLGQRVQINRTAEM